MFTGGQGGGRNVMLLFNEYRVSVGNSGDRGWGELVHKVNALNAIELCTSKRLEFQVLMYILSQ